MQKSLRTMARWGAAALAATAFFWSVSAAAKTGNPSIASVSIESVPHYDQFTATALTRPRGMAVNYAFRIKTLTGGWRVVQGYQSPYGHVFTYTPPSNTETYLVQALALTPYQASRHEWSLAVASPPMVMTPPRPNPNIVTVAASSGAGHLDHLQVLTKPRGLGLDYEFWVKSPGKPWRIAQSWSPKNYYAYFPPAGSAGISYIEGLVLTRSQVQRKLWKDIVGTHPFGVTAPPKALQLFLSAPPSIPVGDIEEDVLQIATFRKAPSGGDVSVGEGVLLTSSNPSVVSVPPYAETSPTNSPAGFGSAIIHTGPVPGTAVITGTCGNLTSSVTIQTVPLIATVFLESPIQAKVTGTYNYSWHVYVRDQFDNAVGQLSDVSVADSTVSPQVVYNAANKDLTVTGPPSGYYVITVHSATPISEADTGDIIIDGTSTQAKF